MLEPPCKNEVCWRLDAITREHTKKSNIFGTRGLLNFLLFQPEERRSPHFQLLFLRVCLRAKRVNGQCGSFLTVAVGQGNEKHKVFENTNRVASLQWPRGVWRLLCIGAWVYLKIQGFDSWKILQSTAIVILNCLWCIIGIFSRYKNNWIIFKIVVYRRVSISVF